MKPIKLKINITQNEITSDYVLECLFDISEKSNKKNQAAIAKQIIKDVAVKGQEGVWEEDWKHMMKKHDIKKHTYFKIIKKLKDAGIIRKSKGKYYLLYTFIDHLGEMSSALNKFYRDNGKTKRD